MIFFSLTEAPLPDPTPSPPNTPKRTRNRPETEPNGAKQSRNGAKRSRNGPKSSFSQWDGRGGGFVGVGGWGGCKGKKKITRPEIQALPSHGSGRYGFGVFGAQDSVLRDRRSVGTRHAFLLITLPSIQAVSWGGQSSVARSGIPGPKNPKSSATKTIIFRGPQMGGQIRRG